MMFINPNILDEGNQMEVLEDNINKMKMVVRCNNCGQPTEYGKTRMCNGFVGCDNKIEINGVSVIDIYNTDKKYNIIYADPPWNYNDKRTGKKMSGGATRHYQTMKIEDIEQLPVKNISSENCMLFMWTTFPNLQEGLDTIKAWGFKYKTLGFSWIKTNKKNNKPFFGIGYYTKSNCEVCLIGVKGKPIKQSNYVSSVVISPREEHSKKPDCVRDKIVELCGDIPRVELFARRQINGWDCWGNELEKESK